MDGRRTGTRERILDAALDFMSEHGYDAVTMRDIADEVGIKAASLYKHFKGKREVFDALIARFRGSLAASYRWGEIAGILLICWTLFELAFIPNGLSVFYFVLGVLQLLVSAIARRSVAE